MFRLDASNDGAPLQSKAAATSGAAGFCAEYCGWGGAAAWMGTDAGFLVFRRSSPNSAATWVERACGVEVTGWLIRPSACTRTASVDNEGTGKLPVDSGMCVAGEISVSVTRVMDVAALSRNAEGRFALAPTREDCTASREVSAGVASEGKLSASSCCASGAAGRASNRGTRVTARLRLLSGWVCCGTGVGATSANPKVAAPPWRPSEPKVARTIRNLMA